MFDEDWQDHFFGFGLNFGVPDEDMKKCSRLTDPYRAVECPECGEIFKVKSIHDHPWKAKHDNRYVLLCRYNCMRSAEKKIEAERMQRAANRRINRQEQSNARKQGDRKRGHKQDDLDTVLCNADRVGAADVKAA